MTINIIIGLFLLFMFIILIVFINCVTAEHKVELLELFQFNQNDDCVMYLINMDHNKDRYTNFITMYANSDLPKNTLMRIDAVNGKRIDISQYVSAYAHDEIKNAKKLKYRTKHYQLTEGAVGCFLSHKLTYQTFNATNNFKYALIFEDDVQFSSNVYSQIRDNMTKLPTDWDIALLGCTCIKCDPANETWNKVNKFYCLHAYIVNKNSCDKILNYLDNVPKINQQIDSLLSDMAEEGKLNIYSLKTPLCTAGKQGTTIQIDMKYFDDINPYEKAPKLDFT